MSPPRHVAILGATGSIGRSALDVIESSRGRLVAAALSAHSRLDDLATLGARHRPQWLVASQVESAGNHVWAGLPPGTRLLSGPEGLEEVAAAPGIDVVLAAIVGSAGLRSAWAALEAGKTLALANKETLVMAGPLVMELAAQRGAAILPVDSEHSAIFQCIQGAQAAGEASRAIRRILLTASGGPFLRWSAERIAAATVEEALAHPTWRMGPKITVDSATMMNKALEIIEARWLFQLSPEQIEVVVHPQSVVHSMVEFSDGAVLAQLGPPDMRLPIQYALTYPERWEGPARRLDVSQPWRLDFEPPDRERFPAIDLGLEAARAGGTAGAVLNAANEAAVARFLAGDLPFSNIVPACRAVLEHHEFDPRPTLSQLLRLDAWAREEASRWAHR